MTGFADVSGLLHLGSSLAGASAAVQREAKAVVTKGALNIKNDWRANAIATAGRHGRIYPYSIGYDPVVTGVGYVEAVIGPDKDKPQGALGNLLEYGSVNNPPHNDGGRALLAEEPRFMAAVEALGLTVLR
jgi:hypothetical protein